IADVGGARFDVTAGAGEDVGCGEGRGGGGQADGEVAAPRRGRGDTPRGGAGEQRQDRACQQSATVVAEPDRSHGTSSKTAPFNLPVPARSQAKSQGTTSSGVGG